MRRLIRFARAAEVAPAILAALALFALMTMTFVDVALRSVANSPIPGAPELTRVLMAATVFSALPIVSARGTHIAVDLTDPLFRGAARRIRDVLIAGGAGVMLLWPAERCLDLAARAAQYGDVTEYLAIPESGIIYAIAVAMFITAAVLIVRAAVLAVAPRDLYEALIDTPGSLG